MKYIAILAALSLTACATTADYKVQASNARATYTAACGEVISAHQRGSITGSRFNTARKACIDADNALDAADSAYAVGQAAQATQGVQRALLFITAAQAVLAALPKEPNR